MVRLGVNVDHVATLRQARGTKYPCPVMAGLMAERAGADQITVHLREDRRHIQENDVIRLKESLTIALNLEIANTPEMVEFALKIKPTWVCLVPEKREELTTEGGLDVVANMDSLQNNIAKLKAAGLKVSLFIEACNEQINAARELAVEAIEIHTGRYADTNGTEQTKEFERIKQAAAFAKQIGLNVHAGHGLHYHNTQQILQIKEIEELNIGHSLVGEAVFCGIEQAVARMREVMR